MKKLIPGILLFLPLSAGAGLIGSVGPSVLTGYESAAENSSGKKYFKSAGTIGYNLGLELPVLQNFMSFGLNAIYGRYYGKSQYSDPKTGLSLPDQKSYFSNTDIMFGMKIRPINLKHLKVFTGGGVYFGNVKLRHDKDDYIKQHGPVVPATFKEVEKGKSSGTFLELGTEIIFSQVSGLRLSAQHFRQNTDHFQTLDNKAINGTYSVFSLQYIHYADKIFNKVK